MSSPVVVNNPTSTIKNLSGYVGNTSNTSNLYQTVSVSNPVNSPYIVTSPSTIPSMSATTVAVNDISDIINSLFSKENLRKILMDRGLEIGDNTLLKMVDGDLVAVKTLQDGVTHTTHIPKKHGGVIDLSTGYMELIENTILKLPDGDIIHFGKDGKITHQTYTNSRKEVIDVSGGRKSLYESLAFCHFGDIHIPSGADTTMNLTLPNRTVIKLFRDDRIEIDDSSSKRIYESEPIRGFNRYLNGSDLLEEFVAFCGTQRISKSEFQDLPLSLFIYWLIVRAAECDGDPTDDIRPLLTNSIKERKSHSHKCRCCGKFLPHKFEKHGINFCSSDHMDEYRKRIS